MMINRLLLLFFFWVGCRDQSVPASAPQTQPDPFPFPAEENHLHAAIFGGNMRSTIEHRHLELYIDRNQGNAEVYLFDDAVNPVDSKLATGTILLDMKSGERRSFTLAYGAPDHHDLLFARVPVKELPNPVTAFIDVKLGDDVYRAKIIYNFNEHADRTPHMHDPRQGGQVAMIGERHIEIVSLQPGEYRVFLSDVHRSALPPTLAKDPSLVIDPDQDDPETLPLRIDPTGQFLEAKGTPDTKKQLPVQVKISFDDKPGAVDFLLISPN
jgi:hypothetical protein